MKRFRDLKFSLTFMALTMIFSLCLIVANLIEIKTIDLGVLTITAGVIVFPISYIINDCVVEVYGFSRARVMIWAGFAAGLFVTLMLQLAIALPGSEEWKAQEAMVAIYGGVPRIIFASFLAFVCGSFVNAWTMSHMKKSESRKTEESADTRTAWIRNFSLRAILSTIYGETLDSAIFFPVAFAGILPWRGIFMLIVSQAIIKTMYEILILPVTLIAVRKLRKIETEIYDLQADIQ